MNEPIEPTARNRLPNLPRLWPAYARQTARHQSLWPDVQETFVPPAPEGNVKSYRNPPRRRRYFVSAFIQQLRLEQLKHRKARENRKQASR